MTPRTEAGNVEIESLHDRGDLIPVVARWHWDEWGRPGVNGTLEGWTRGLAERTREGAIPMSWVALVDRHPVGSIALIDNDMDTHPELWPWLSGLLVLPEYRTRGIGSALTIHCEREAAALGVETLYLYTSAAEAFYRRRGYELIGRERYEDEDVAIMSKRVAAPD